MIDLAGYPDHRLAIDVDRVTAEMWRRIAVLEVLGLRYMTTDEKRQDMWRCQGWHNDLDIDETLRSEIVRVARELRRRYGTQPWIDRLIGQPAVIAMLAPLVEQLQEFTTQIATTWRVCFTRGSQVEVLDHRGAVLVGVVRETIVVINELRKWESPHDLEQRNRPRASAAEKSLRAKYRNNASILEKDLCCPDQRADRVNPTEWPANLPTNCPAASLPDATGVVYRLVSSARTHQSTAELGGGKGSWSSPCEKAGLSCWMSLGSVLEIRSNNLKTNKAVHLVHVSAARLLPQHGKLARTGPWRHHATLWLRATYDPFELFEILHEHDLAPSSS